VPIHPFEVAGVFVFGRQRVVEIDRDNVRCASGVGLLSGPADQERAQAAVGAPLAVSVNLCACDGQSSASSITTERGTLSASRHVVVDVDVNVPIRRHVLDTEPTITVAVGV